VLSMYHIHCWWGLAVHLPRCWVSLFWVLKWPNAKRCKFHTDSGALKFLYLGKLKTRCFYHLPQWCQKVLILEETVCNCSVVVVEMERSCGSGRVPWWIDHYHEQVLGSNAVPPPQLYQSGVCMFPDGCQPCFVYPTRIVRVREREKWRSWSNVQL
jgi:hypothetical protein